MVTRRLKQTCGAKARGRLNIETISRNHPSVCWRVDQPYRWYRFGRWDIFCPGRGDTLGIRSRDDRRSPAVDRVTLLSYLHTDPRASLTFNRWSAKQKVVDGLAEDISWAIDKLLNRSPGIDPTDKFIEDWKIDFDNWCADVSAKLGNRAFFTRADQLHFDYLGFIPPVQFYQHPRLNHLLSQLRLKIERLRDVINWAQERRR